MRPQLRRHSALQREFFLLIQQAVYDPRLISAEEISPAVNKRFFVSVAEDVFIISVAEKLSRHDGYVFFKADKRAYVNVKGVFIHTVYRNCKMPHIAGNAVYVKFAYQDGKVQPFDPIPNQAGEEAEGEVYFFRRQIFFCAHNLHIFIVSLT